MIAGCAPLHELGQVYAFYNSLNSIIPIGVAQFYAWLWEVTQG